MSPDFAVRAWKDPHFRDGLSEDARAALPDHPAGSMEGADAALGNLSAFEEARHRSPAVLLGSSNQDAERCRV